MALDSHQNPEALITAYLDEELDSARRAEVEKMLAEKAELRQLLDAQRRLRSMLRNDLPSEPAPVQLRARIRKQLAESQRAPGFISMLGDIFSTHTLKAATAVAALAIMLVLPWMRGGTIEHADGERHYVELAGTAVCVDCTLLQQLGTQDFSHQDSHQLGLQQESGELVGFLNVSHGSELLHDFSHANKKMRVKGYMISGQPFIEVHAFQSI